MDQRWGQVHQMDGSHHDWLEKRGQRLVLMGYIDDESDLPPKYRSRSYVRIRRGELAPIFGPFSMLVLKFASHF